MASSMNHNVTSMAVVATTGIPIATSVISTVNSMPLITSGAVATDVVGSVNQVSTAIVHYKPNTVREPKILAVSSPV